MKGTFRSSIGRERHGKERIPMIESWPKESSSEMIDCPNQPGSLRITRSACFKRRRLALKKFSERDAGDDLFNYFLQKELSRCRECPVTGIYSGQGR